MMKWYHHPSPYIHIVMAASCCNCHPPWPCLWGPWAGLSWLDTGEVPKTDAIYYQTSPKPTGFYGFGGPQRFGHTFFPTSIAQAEFPGFGGHCAWRLGRLWDSVLGRKNMRFKSPLQLSILIYIYANINKYIYIYIYTCIYIYIRYSTSYNNGV